MFPTLKIDVNRSQTDKKKHHSPAVSSRSRFLFSTPFFPAFQTPNLQMSLLLTLSWNINRHNGFSAFQMLSVVRRLILNISLPITATIAEAP